MTARQESSARAKGAENGPEERDRFESLTKRLVSVPKKEIDKKAAAYERKKARKKAG